MDINFNIADLFTAIEEFKAIITELRQRAGEDLAEVNRLKIVMAMAKKDIEELFDRVGREH